MIFPPRGPPVLSWWLGLGVWESKPASLHVIRPPSWLVSNGHFTFCLTQKSFANCLDPQSYRPHQLGRRLRNVFFRYLGIFLHRAWNSINVWIVVSIILGYSQTFLSQHDLVKCDISKRQISRELMTDSFNPTL